MLFEAVDVPEEGKPGVHWFCNLHVPGCYFPQGTLVDLSISTCHATYSENRIPKVNTFSIPHNSIKSCAVVAQFIEVGLEEFKNASIVLLDLQGFLVNGLESYDEFFGFFNRNFNITGKCFQKV